MQPKGRASAAAFATFSKLLHVGCVLSVHTWTLGSLVSWIRT
jgi:hypothetical protein